jgi:SAM-dependent methyltransferase
LLQGFRDLGWRTFGVEPNPAMAAYARARHGLDVVASSWEAFATDRRFDAIAMIQVLPHLADPRAALAQAAGLLKPGGGVLIETWNVESLTARAFGSAWHEYSPPSVLHWFSPKRLGRLAKTVGLAPWAVGRPSKCLDAGHAAGLLEYKFAGSRAGPAVRFLRRFVPANCPIPYPAEDLFWGYYVKIV